MNLKKVSVYVKLNWIKLLLVLLAVTVLTLTVFALIIGMKAMAGLESFYKQMQLSMIPLQIFIAVVTAFVFASIYTVFHYWFFFAGGMTKLGQKKIKSVEVNVKWDEVIGMDEVKREAWEVVQLLKDRTKLQRVGGQIVKGDTAFPGAPGCGKTVIWPRQ